MAPKRTTSAAIARAEKALGVSLPDEYTAFLRTQEPTSPLLTLEQTMTAETVRADLPFPFTEVDAARILAARAGGAAVFLEPEDSIGGALPIADGGCNDITWLVLTGPLRGTVWSGGEPGWLPHARADGTLLKFTEWYETVADASPPSARKAAPARKRVKAPPPIDRAAYQLNLRNQGLTVLPAEACEMTAVGAMYLGGNKLTALPEAMGRVGPTLFALELGPNPLGALDGALLARFDRLRMLDLKGTGLCTLPETLTGLPLRELFLNDNPHLDVAQALAVAARIPTLRWLGLAACGLTEVPPGVAALTQLERLYLNDNAIAALPETLPKWELLGLMNNAIDRIPDGLIDCVQNLYFGGNPGARAEKRRFDARRKGFVLLG